MGDYVFVLWVAIALGVWSIVWEVGKGFKATTRRLDRLEERLSERSKPSP